MSKKKTATSKPRGSRRPSMKAEVFVPAHDPIRALGEWMDRQSKATQKPTTTPASECSIIVMMATGSPQQLTELMEKAKKLKLLL